VSATAEYESLVKPHLEDLRKYCFYLTHSKWDGEDLYQEVLLKSLVYFLNHKPYQEIKPFLIRVARNLWIDHCRMLQRKRKLSLTSFRTSWLDSDYAEVSSLIEWIGEKLPSRSIEMLLLSDYFGYTMQETADALGTSVPAVKSVLFRTRALLRQYTADALHQADPSKRIPLDTERWSRAIMQDLPPCL